MSESIIYGFHIPLFFIVSGFLLSDNAVGGGFFERLRHLGKTLLLPYLLFFLISYLYWILTKNVGNSAARFQGMSVYQPLLGFFIGTGSEIVVNVVLWFFPAIFVAHLMYFVFCKISGDRFAFFAFILISIGHYYWFKESNQRIWFGIDSALYGAAFIGFGRNFKFLLQALVFRLPLFFVLPASLLLFVIYVFLALENGKPDLNNAYVGLNLFLYFSSAIFGFLTAFIFSTLMPKSRVAEWLSLNSLFIFPLHWIFFRIITGVLQIGFSIESPYLAGSYLWTFVYSFVAILMVVPVIWFWGVRSRFAW